jgi:hypothetical protein
MAVNIPISGDASGVMRSLQQMQQMIRQMGADARAFEGIDLSHPEAGGLNDELRQVIRNFEQLTKIGRGATASSVRGMVGRGGAGGTEADSLARFTQWFEHVQKAYADPGERDRHIQRVGGYVFQGTRFGQGDSGGSYDSGGTGAGGGGGGAGVSKLILGGLSAGLKAASKDFLPALLAYAGVKTLGPMAAQGIGQAQGEAASNDALLRTIQGAPADFDALRESVRATTKGLYLTFQEGQALSQQFAKLTNETDPTKISAGVRTAAGFARAYGLDPTATNSTFASAKYLGEDPHEFAALLAEAVSQGNMSGQADQVSQALLGFLQQSSRTMLMNPLEGAADEAGLYAGMNATGNPMLKGSNGLAILGNINGAISQGGGGGMAGQVMMMRALAANGITDPWQQNELLQGGAWASPNTMDMFGPNIKNGNQTNFDAAMAQFHQQYKGDKDSYQVDNALATLFNLTPMQARMLQTVPQKNLDTMVPWLEQHGMSLSNMNPTSIQDVTNVLAPGADLSAWKNKILAPGSGYTLSAADSSDLNSASGGDALKVAIVRALGDSGMGGTPGTDSQQTMADYVNNLTQAGAALLPAVTDMRAAVDGLTGAVASLSQLLGGGVSDLPGEGTPTNPHGVPAVTSGAKKVFQAKIAAVAKSFGLDPGLMNALTGVESGFDPTNVSPTGAYGLMQLTGATADDMFVNRYDVDQNILGGNKRFAQMKAKFGYDDVAIAAYHEGPGGQGIAHFAQTGDMSQLTPAARAEVNSVEAAYQAGGGSLASLHLRADPVVVVIKYPNGQVAGKAQVPLNGRVRPSGQN